MPMLHTPDLLDLTLMLYIPDLMPDLMSLQMRHRSPMLYIPMHDMQTTDADVNADVSTMRSSQPLDVDADVDALHSAATSHDEMPGATASIPHLRRASSDEVRAAKRQRACHARPPETT